MKNSSIIYTAILLVLLSIKSQGQDTDTISNNKNLTANELSQTESSIKLNKVDISTLPFRNLNKFGLSSPSAYYLKNNRMFFYGIEGQTGNYFIDGMYVTEASDFPVSSIGNYKLYTQNTPIHLGYALIGITELKTKDVGRELDFSILAYTDFGQGINTYNTEFTLKVPMASKKRKLSNKPLASLFFGGKYNLTNNIDPVWKQCNKLDPDVLNELRTNPLRRSDNQSGTYQNAEFVTADDFIDCKYPDNAGRNGWNLYSKVDLPVFKGANLRIGNYSAVYKSDVFDFDNAIFNSANNQTQSTKNINTYLNFNQLIKFSDGLTLKYDLHVQYTYYNSKTESKQHKDNFFEYGYLGTFNTFKKPTFEMGSDSVNGEYYENVWLLNSWDFDTLVEWSPKNFNPELAAYTNNYYNIYQNNPVGNYQNTAQIQLGGGLLNGQNPRHVYGLWNNTGMQANNYQESENQKIRGTLKFDLSWKSHTFTLGGEYNKETQRKYAFEPSGLWLLMRNLTNFHIRELDLENPVTVDHNGNVDTIIYFRNYDAESQRTFDKNLRRALGLDNDGLDFIITDSYDMENNTISYYDKYGVRYTIKTPENLLSLNLFSPQELLNSGFSYVNYAGYDYTGNKQAVNNDPYSFYTDFSIDATQPVYGSAYIQDKFSWKGLNVRIGLRFDMYNANRPYLNDNYSLFPIYNIDETIENNLIEFDKPNNLDGSDLVYVNNTGDPTNVVGFRNGDKWYNEYGDEVTSPEYLGDGIGPYLKYPEIYSLSNKDWQPDMTFQNSKTQVNFLPQINIDYTIKDRLNLYVNYNSSTRNPYAINDFKPDNYYYWHYVAENKIVLNPGLKPMKSGKLFAGVKGVIYRNIVADVAYLMTTIDNYYHVSFIEEAYPTDYYTILNSKNRISNEGILLSINYINPTNSGFYGTVNLTKLFPKESDLNYFEISALVLNSQIGYRFGDRDNYSGPSWGNNIILRGLSASLFYQFRKGTPYYYINDNNVKSARLTPNFNLLNLNIQKDFYLGKRAVINVYLTVENLLNSKNSFEVYSDTGLPDDDGFLNDPDWQEFINNQLNPETYRLLYQMHLNNPAHFDIPRIWRVGLAFRY